MKPTKSILCHRSNSGSSPRAPLAATVSLFHSHSLPPLSLFLSVCLSRSPLLLRRRSVRGMPPFVPPPSRSPAQNFSPATPAESSPLSGLNSPSSRRLTTAHETSTISHGETRALSTDCLSQYSSVFHGGLRSSGLHRPTDRVQLFAVGSIPGCESVSSRYILGTRYSVFYSWGLHAPDARWRIRCVPVLDCSLRCSSASLSFSRVCCFRKRGIVSTLVGGRRIRNWSPFLASLKLRCSFSGLSFVEQRGRHKKSREVAVNHLKVPVEFSTLRFRSYV